MPRTPVEVRDWNSRTSVDLKRIALPLRVASRTSSSSVSSSTPISRSVGSGLLLVIVAVVRILDERRPEPHGDLAGRRDVGEGGHAVAADRAVRGREHDVQAAPFILVLGQREDGRDGLAVRQRQEIDHRPALGVRPAFGQAPHLHPIDAAEVGEEQHRIVGRGDEQVGDRVLFLGRHSGAALAAALLLAEHGQRECA